MKKLKSLIEDILQLTVVKAQEEAVQDVSLEKVVDESLQKISYMEGFDQVDIQKNLSANMVKTKKLRISMVVENLLTNAVKYRDPEEERPYIKICSERKGRDFIFCVEDNGLGVPEDQQAQLFEMFKRFHPKVAYGSGLGLYLIKKSAEAMGAEISFSDLGGGSSFTLVIPTE